MTNQYLLMPDTVLKVKEEAGEWRMKEFGIKGVQFECLAIDPHDTDRMYAGTFDHGLWVSDDGGRNWSAAGEGIESSRVMAVAVSPIETINGKGVVWAGTEPSRLYRSEDGGKTWMDCPALLGLPSKSEWSFPPRPHTHHVRWIQPDRFDEAKLFVGIELGGVMRSLDKGATWEDRKADSQFDCHTMTTHPQREGRIYEAAGGGFAQTKDGGATWETDNRGLDPFHYLVNIAVAPDDSECILAAGARGPRQSYQAEHAETVILKKDTQGWRRVKKGLPQAEETTVSALVPSLTESGVFYAANNKGIFYSEDYGESWQELPIVWPEKYQKKRIKQLIIK